MRLGCCTYIFSSPHYDPPYDESVEIIGEMGFKSLEFIVFRTADLDDYYTPQKIRELRHSCKNYGMKVSEFAFYSPVINDLGHLDEAKREAALANFKKGVLIAKELDAEAVNMVSSWPQDMHCPIEYIPCYITPFVDGAGHTSPKMKMTIPVIDYAELWDTYMETIARCLELCVENGLDLYIEGHAHVIVSGVDAMLRMFDRIHSPHLGINFDTSWHLTMREYLPMSIRRLGSKIKHFHLRDGDSMFYYALPCGAGTIDWEGFIAAVRDIGFNGALSFEMGGYGNVQETVKYIRESKEHVEKAMTLAGVNWEK
jgi:sugar phosphate isomerase/epimerase